MIRLYLCLMAALGVGVASVLAGNGLGADATLASLAGDAMFLVVLAGLVRRNPTLPLASGGRVLTAVIAFLGTGILLADLGGGTYATIPPLGRVLVHVFSIGYYPGGADAPFDFGAMLWGLSMLVLCAVGLGIAGLVSLGKPRP